MSNEKCCKNCVHFCNEGVNETGLCCMSLVRKKTTYSYNCCVAHEWKLPKWTEITPDNAKELYKVLDRVILAHIIPDTVVVAYEKPKETYHSLEQLAELRGYYYYVLPELKIE